MNKKYLVVFVIDYFFALAYFLHIFWMFPFIKVPQLPILFWYDTLTLSSYKTVDVLARNVSFEVTTRHCLMGFFGISDLISLLSPLFPSTKALKNYQQHQKLWKLKYKMQKLKRLFSKNNLFQSIFFKKIHYFVTLIRKS